MKKSHSLYLVMRKRARGPSIHFLYKKVHRPRPALLTSIIVKTTNRGGGKWVTALHTPSHVVVLGPSASTHLQQLQRRDGNHIIFLFSLLFSTAPLYPWPASTKPMLWQWFIYHTFSNIFMGNYKRMQATYLRSWHTDGKIIIARPCVVVIDISTSSI